MINILSDIINRESNTSDILLSLKSNENFSSKVIFTHTKSIYDLLKILSESKFYLEFYEPVYTNLDEKSIIKLLLEDVSCYCKYIKEHNIIENELCSLVNVKVEILKFILTDNYSYRLSLSIDELKNYNGANGNPSYVAINNIIYDVTNNSSWSDGTHFGLSSGEDLTNEFNSCHSNNQEILTKIKAIGNLVVK